MSGVPARGEGRVVRIDVDVAERLLEASAEHAQDVISDAEFLEVRERLITSAPDPEQTGRT